MIKTAHHISIIVFLGTLCVHFAGCSTHKISQPDLIIRTEDESTTISLVTPDNQHHPPENFELSSRYLEDHFEFKIPDRRATLTVTLRDPESQQYVVSQEGKNKSRWPGVSLKRPILLAYPGSEELKPFIQKYARDEKNALERTLNDRMDFFLMIDRKIRDRGMPFEIRWIPYLESKYNVVDSPEGFAGLWQLSRSTGRRFGLEINKSQDERLDPERSTDAALDTLQYLYDKLHCWLLAIAAYNAGEGRIQEAIEQTNTRDFYLLADAEVIPHSTKNYVFSILALNQISRNFLRYGIDLDTRLNYLLSPLE